MQIIEHTINWSKGEILEASIMRLCGLLLLLAVFLFWKFGTTPHAKAMIVPFFVLGMLYSTMGGFGIHNNIKNMTSYQKEFEVNKSQFVKNERLRVEGFEKIFKITFPLAAIFLLAGTALFLTFKHSQLRAIGLALILLGFSTYLIDFFAEERANTYYQHLLRAEQTSIDFKEASNEKNI